MVVFVLIIIAASLMTAMVLPGCTDDMNVGFYLLITAVFAISAAVVMLRKSFKIFSTLSWYIVMFLVLFAAGEATLIYFSADDIPGGKEQAIIVAGGGLFVESRLTDELEKRLDLALEVYENNPGLPIILSGGTDENRALPQSTAMQAYIDRQIKERELKPPEIIIDDNSNGLYNNVRTSLELAEKNPAYVIVSRHNVARTKIMTYRLSPESTVLGAEYPLSKYIIYYIREFGYAIKTAVWDGLI